MFTLKLLTRSLILLCAMGSVPSFAQSNPTVSISTIASAPATNILHINTPNPEKNASAHSLYYHQLLELALQKTSDTDGPFTIAHQNNYTSNRLIAELMRDNSDINVIWTSNSKEREERMLPVKISILRGLNSYRVFLIRKEDQIKFHQVNSLLDLRHFFAGQGAQWPDTIVMQNNGLPVVGVAQADLLFVMLANKRFDYFPRGLYEVWGEQKLNADKNIVVEDSLMLHYPAPIYFFVNKKNVALANRIERGLRIAMQDGSFDKLFFSIPGFTEGLREITNPSRKTFTLNVDFVEQD